MALNINGTTGISGVDGSASAPALQGTDSNTGINFGTDTVNINTGGSTRATVDSSGKVGIGTTSPSNALDVQGGTSNTAIVARSTDSKAQISLVDNSTGGVGSVVVGAEGNALFLTSGSGGSERMRIASDGNVGINETNPARLLTVSSSSTNSYNISNATTVDAILLKNSGGNASGRNIGIQMNGGGSNGEVFMHLVGVSSTESAFYIGNRSGGTRRVRLAIEPTGRLICGTSGITSNTAGGQVEVHGAIGFNDTGIAIKTTTTDTSSRSFMKFMNASNSVQGSIGMGGSTGVDYNTSSDYRLKENETVISDGITRVKQLIARKFNFKIEPDKTVDGFFAHEVSSIVPEAITGEKDAMKAETFYEEGDTIPSDKSVGDPKTYSSTEIQPQQIDQSKLVPLLTAALQEAIAKIEVLETKVAALEAA